MTAIAKLVIAAISVACLAGGDFVSDETNLLTTLRTGYSTDSRPDSTTQVNASLMIFALNKIDIGSEVMSLSGIVVATWVDSRLTWNPASHNGLTSIVVNRSYIWTPPLVIENEIDRVSIVGSEGVPLRVYPNGQVAWTPPVIITSSCSADITYYPYDKQSCKVTLIGWTYTQGEVEMGTMPNRPVDTTYYSENGEWELRKTGFSTTDLNDMGDVYLKLQFTMDFRRRWQFYGQNIILPIVLNSLLMAVVFVLPIESGEKMSYCLTVLLSYIVLLTLVSNKLPPISSQESIIQIYLSVVMSIGTLGTLLTVAVVHLYHEDEDKAVPGWLQFLMSRVLMPLVCRCKSARVASPGRVSEVEKATEKTNFGDKRKPNSWKTIARTLDTFFFRYFGMSIVVVTIGFLVKLTSNYYLE